MNAQKDNTYRKENAKTAIEKDKKSYYRRTKWLSGEDKMAIGEEKKLSTEDKSHQQETNSYGKSAKQGQEKSPVLAGDALIKYHNH